MKDYLKAMFSDSTKLKENVMTWNVKQNWKIEFSVKWFQAANPRINWTNLIACGWFFLAEQVFLESDKAESYAS